MAGPLGDCPPSADDLLKALTLRNCSIYWARYLGEIPASNGRTCEMMWFENVKVEGLGYRIAAYTILKDVPQVHYPSQAFSVYGGRDTL